MPATPYFVRSVSLAAVIRLGDAASRIAAPGEPVKDVGILTLPGGAVGNIRVHLGQKGDPIPLNMQGQNFHLEQAEDTGIWVSVPTAIGAITVDFLIGLASAVATV